MSEHQIKPSPLHILWHYALGEMPDFLNKCDGPVGWVRWSHRGIHRMDNIVFPKRQERYVRSAKWEVKMNTAFEEVVRGCAEPNRFGKTWIVPELIDGLLALHKMGYAHSWESYEAGKVVAGVFGLQIGGWVTLSSMYGRVGNASKAALGRCLLQLKDRGFELADRGMVPDHSVDYGVEWWPRWKYELAVPRLIAQTRTLSDSTPMAPIPWQLKYLTPPVRKWRGIKRRIVSDPTEPQVPAKEQAADGDEVSPVTPAAPKPTPPQESQNAA